MKILNTNRRAVYVVAALMVLFFIVVFKAILFKEPPKQNLNVPVIECRPEDYRDTPFIQQLNKNDTVTLPDKNFMKTLSREELAMLYHRYVENLQYWCKRLERRGKLRDGGWDICEEAKYTPRDPCLVYSFGINNDFSFDDAVIDEYGCEVHSFDPSMDMSSHQRSPKNFFHKMGIGANTAEETQRWKEKSLDNKEGWDLRTLDDIRKTLGHTERAINIIKMDIELSEWTVLPSMLESAAMETVEHLLVEFHLNLIYPPAEESKSTYLMALGILKDIYDKGFRIFWTHRNTDGGLVFVSKCRRKERCNCHELNFVKVK